MSCTCKHIEGDHHASCLPPFPEGRQCHHRDGQCSGRHCEWMHCPCPGRDMHRDAT